MNRNYEGYQKEEGTSENEKVPIIFINFPYRKEKCKKKKSLPRGIEPRSPALIGINDKRKSSPLDQGRCNDRVTARPLGWLMEDPGHLDIMSSFTQKVIIGYSEANIVKAVFFYQDFTKFSKSMGNLSLSNYYSITLWPGCADGGESELTWLHLIIYRLIDLRVQ